MEYERCYVFQPDGGRVTKRRRTEPQGLQASWKLRRKAYESTWRQQQELINSTLSEINKSTVAGITQFLDDAAHGTQAPQIPTAIVLARPGDSIHHAITTALSQRQLDGVQRRVVNLSSSLGSNLETALKALIQGATTQTIPDEEDEDDSSALQRKGRKMLNYDLHLLHDYVRETGTQQVIVAFEDAEAFESDLLSEFIELLGHWRDRIPVAFIFNIATSVDFLQQRLSKRAVKCLNGRVFDVSPAGDDVERVVEAINQGESRLWIGPGLASVTLNRQHDYIQSIQSFMDAIRYAHMSHYYANATSIFLIPGVAANDVSIDCFEAVRNLDSFRTYARQLLDNGKTAAVRNLLDSDAVLLKLVRTELNAARETMAKLMAALKVLRSLQTCFPSVTLSPLSSLHVQATSGKLQGSPMIRSLLISIRKAPSDVGFQLLTSMSNPGMPKDLADHCTQLAKELTALVGDGDEVQLLRSEDDVRNSNLRTTVVAQKVELSKQKSTLSKHDALYTGILRRFTEWLEEYLADALIDPKSLVFHEIFIYDLKSPHQEVFAPRPRHAIERALEAPHDYLDCECCAADAGQSEDTTLASTQPATAVLYQLYLESGSLINTSDLWQAFQAVMGDERPVEVTTALFQRALAELRYLGFVKVTGKRVDHVAKVAWNGL